MSTIMSNNDIQIVIASGDNMGKTTLAQEIVAALRHCGFPVAYDSDDAKTADRVTQMKRLDSIKHRLYDSGAQIVVQEKGLARRSLHGRYAPVRAEFKKADDTEGGSLD